jgi:hypothetical protein
MKTNSTLNVAIIAVTLLFSNLNVFAFDSETMISRKNRTLTQVFYRTDTILVVLPGLRDLTTVTKNEIETYVCWKKSQQQPVYVYKPESEITKSDFKKHLLVYGSLYSFQRKEILNIPIWKEQGGFRFNDTVYNQPNDAFYYINERATRMYICKNSNEAATNLFSFGIGAFPMHIFRGNEILITGTYQQNDSN